MGNCFSACVTSKDSATSIGQEKNARGKRRVKRAGSKLKAKASRNNSPPSTLKDKLSVTTVESFNDDVGTKNECLSEGCQLVEDLTVIGHALPIQEKPASPFIEPGVSNAKIIVVQPSVTSENTSEETLPEEGIKRPITGSESNPSLSSPAEEPKCNDELVLEELGNDEQSSATLPPPRVSEGPETPERSSHFQILEFLKIRLDMAANNMEMNRLLANVDRALDRTSRIREQGFRRMRAARESRRVSQDIQEDTGTDGEETETEDGEEGEEGEDGGDTPPPPIPRICWQ
ncbi:hypothetical protein OS493_004583 [Desmophyllum pertusum]|uniref:Uncharacterized protein n=1 Tax=Desmophyllum pertusum TaxID=174260 RepID=A0A9W9ZHB5_9CNID|nr:hypothetical protein OS493_004583 [Desmophyllum pertusum]